MYSMTDSKIIQQAQQAQQFQQNPTYFHRNINPNQISHDITFIQNDVNIFINKLHNTQSKIKFTQSKLKLPQQTNLYNYKSKQYRINKPKSQIDQISSNTQSLIQDLTWMNTVKNIQRKFISCNFNEHSIILDSQRQFNNAHQNPKNRRLSHTEHGEKNPIKIQNKNMQFSNSKSAQIHKSRFIRQSKRKLPNTIDIFNRSLTVQTSVENQQLKNKNKIYFGNKNLDLLEQFDDKDTVVNEPLFKGKRKYSKAKVKTQQLQQNKHQQGSKLTKKKLFQQILKLQHSIQQLKNQKQRNHNSQINRQNQALFFNRLNQEKPIYAEDYYQKYQPKFQRKSIQNSQQLKNHSIQTRQRKNITINNGYSNQLLNKPKVIANKFQVTSTQNIKNKSKSSQNHKISLEKWVSQVWQDI